jgi:hypothetical protein
MNNAELIIGSEVLILTNCMNTGRSYRIVSSSIIYMLIAKNTNHYLLFNLFFVKIPGI